jgi:hypothetical protein
MSRSYSLAFGARVFRHRLIWLSPTEGRLCLNALPRFSPTNADEVSSKKKKPRLGYSADATMQTQQCKKTAPGSPEASIRRADVADRPPRIIKLAPKWACYCNCKNTHRNQSPGPSRGQARSGHVHASHVHAGGEPHNLGYLAMFVPCRP